MGGLPGAVRFRRPACRLGERSRGSYFAEKRLTAVPGATFRAEPVEYPGWRCRTAQLTHAVTGVSFPCTPLLGTAATAGLVAEVLDLGLGRPEDFERHAKQHPRPDRLGPTRISIRDRPRAPPRQAGPGAADGCGRIPNRASGDWHRSSVRVEWTQWRRRHSGARHRRGSGGCVPSFARRHAADRAHGHRWRGSSRANTHVDCRPAGPRLGLGCGQCTYRRPSAWRKRDR